MDVRIDQSRIAGGGRGVFAEKDFLPGDIVFSTNRPYVAELDTSRMADTCAWCFIRGRSSSSDENDDGPDLLQLGGAVEMRPCSACRRVKYCSKSCQSKAWKQEHKYECKILSSEGRPDFPHGVRAVIKLLGRLKADPEGKDEKLLSMLQAQPFADQKILEIMKKTNPKRFEDFELLAYGAWKYAGEPKIGGSDSLMIAKALFFNVMSNTLSLSAPHDDISLGVGCDPIVCSCNHSCDPNTIVVFNQPGMLVRALRKISKDEEIFIKYIDITNPRSVRQAELRESYYFSCTCAKCSLGETTPEDRFLKPADSLRAPFTTVADGLIKRHQAQLDRFAVNNNSTVPDTRLAAISAEAFSVSGITFDFNKGNDFSSESEVLDALKLTLNTSLWPVHRQPVPHLIRQLLTLRLAEGRIYPAWRIAAYMHVNITPHLHPVEFYPDRLVDMWTLATLTNHLLAPAQREVNMEIKAAGLDLQMVFVGLLMEVNEMMEKCYGRMSPFGRLVGMVYERCVGGGSVGEEEMKRRVDAAWMKFEAVARSVDVLAM